MSFFKKLKKLLKKSFKLQKKIWFPVAKKHHKVLLKESANVFRAAWHPIHAHGKFGKWNFTADPAFLHAANQNWRAGINRAVNLGTYGTISAGAPAIAASAAGALGLSGLLTSGGGTMSLFGGSFFNDVRSTLHDVSDIWNQGNDLYNAIGGGGGESAPAPEPGVYSPSPQPGRIPTWGWVLIGAAGLFVLYSVSKRE